MLSPSEVTSSLRNETIPLHLQTRYPFLYKDVSLKRVFQFEIDGSNLFSYDYGLDHCCTQFMYVSWVVKHCG